MTIIDPAPEAQRRGLDTGVRRRILVIALVGALVDWATKTAAVLAIEGAPISVGTTLDLRVSRNPGIAFGMASRLPSGVVVAATLLITAGLVLLAVRGELPSPTGSALIIGGAIGNLGDRLLGGTVVDSSISRGGHRSMWPMCSSPSGSS